LNEDAIGEERFRDIEIIRAFLSAPRKSRAEAIAKFEKKQLERWSGFFSSFESNPLIWRWLRSFMRGRKG